MTVSRETLEVLDRYRVAVSAITDSHTRALTEAWVNAWDNVADELDNTLTALAGGEPTRAQLRRSRKLAATLDNIRAELADALARAEVLILDTLPAAVNIAGATNVALIESQLPPLAGSGLVTSWDLVNPDALAAIVTRTAGQIHASSIPLSDESVTVMRRNLVRGLAAGDNPRTTAARMVKDTRDTFNGGLARALNIARTETLDAMRAASDLSDKANKDLVGGWTWTATLGPRTCPACWGMHGTDWPMSAPGPEGHQQCRCTRVPRVKTWTELGFVGIEEPPSLLPDNVATFDRLTPAEQANILGPARFKAWQAGEYPMSSWATKRSTPEWRDSWVVSPITNTAAVTAA